MAGDYYRFLAEIKTGEQRLFFGNSSQNSYEEAFVLALEHLKPSNPIRLATALNYSTLCFEIGNDPKKACKLSKEAFDTCILGLDTVSEEERKDACVVLSLLRDNLTLWQQSLEEVTTTIAENTNLNQS